MNKYQKIDSELSKLFESENNDGLLFNMTSQSPMQPLPKEYIFEHCKNPITGEYYEGMYLMGVFASIGVLNNNNRIYFKENYIELLEILRYQIHNYGVYGELEHPKQYASDANNFSHKLVDIWYDESTDNVMGIIVLLNEGKGLKAQEIVKSGGTLALSARGGGKEEKNIDGTISAYLRLLITFDIVANPGFSNARQHFIGDINSETIPTISIYKPSTNTYVKVEEVEPIFESQKDQNVSQQQQQVSNQQQETEAEILKDGDKKQQKQIENKLQKQVQQSLNESFNLLQEKITKPKPNGVFLEEPIVTDERPEIMDNMFENFDAEFDSFMDNL